MAASTGCDSQPYFRVFNPSLQSEKFDKLGKYIKKYLPIFKSVESLKKLQLIDSEQFLLNSIQTGMKILGEGAQGSLLDIDFGTYPFVTSSTTTAAGACIGLGVAPNQIGEVFGIFKAYSTRVGSGPFPTELFDSDAEKMAKIGNEFGSTTGRARRCGWIDLVSLKYSVNINGVTKLIMMKGDVLSGFKKIKICTAYQVDGVEIDYFPFDINSNKGKRLLNSMHKIISYVPQSIFITDNSILENIAFGIPVEKINHEKVKFCASIANIHDYINDTSKGYQTTLGERGIKLSGGQIQRIGIARALYKEPKILIFDEATSALDTNTERKVIQSISSLNKQITMIFITHRLKTISNCNKVFEVENGKVKKIFLKEEIQKRIKDG